MGIIHQAIKTIHYADAQSAQSGWLNQLHPITKLVIAFGYLIMVVSVPKYGLATLLLMTVFPVLIMIFADIPIGKTLRQLWLVIAVLCLPGIANLIYDQSEFVTFGNMVITGGVISMLSLLLKGTLGVFTSFILLSTTSIEKICYALQVLHFPNKLVVMIMLIYRYLIVLLKEADRITQAYQMRSGNQIGIKYKAWGTLVGSLFLRSSDRAQLVYQSMSLRGFNGNFYPPQSKFSLKDGSIVLFCLLLLTFGRFLFNYQ
nr:cobalt ECF transporter T component CbiQ [uncultured Carboxylicivirga sp.]